MQMGGTVQGGYLRMAFEKLPSEMREILFLVDIMAMKYKEAAKVTNVPDGTVMSRARRALADLVDGTACANTEYAIKTTPLKPRYSQAHIN